MLRLTASALLLLASCDARSHRPCSPPAFIPPATPLSSPTAPRPARLFAEPPKHLQDKSRFRKLTDFDDENDRVHLSRPDMEDWQFDTATGELFEGKPTFDWKEVPYRADQLDEKHSNLLPGLVEEEVLDLIRPVLTMFGDSVEVLEADKAAGTLRFKYYGLVRNQYGMEAWCRQEVEKVWPEVNEVQVRGGGGQPKINIEWTQRVEVQTESPSERQPGIAFSACPDSVPSPVF